MNYGFAFRFASRAVTAFFAISRLRSGERDSLRAFPPREPSDTAALFFFFIWSALPGYLERIGVYNASAPFANIQACRPFLTGWLDLFSLFIAGKEAIGRGSVFANANPSFGVVYFVSDSFHTIGKSCY